MNLAAFLGMGVGAGLLGVVVGLTPRRQSLQSIIFTIEGWPNPGHRPISDEVERRQVPKQDVRHAWTGWLRDRALSVAERWPSAMLGLQRDLSATNSTIEELIERVVFAGVAGAVTPPLLWVILVVLGVKVSVLVVGGLVLAGAFGSALLQVARLRKRGDLARRHARKMIGCYLDLVVLGLAGGLGIESALHSAALVAETPMALRLLRAMEEARDAGTTPWAALAGLGREIGVPELEELAVAVGLAGTEGARIRSTLAAKASSIRTHELADAEVAANAATEKLFMPGVLLLLGFVIFIGYPAVTRLTAGL